MDHKTLLTTLKKDFVKVPNEGNLFEKGTEIYAKQIKDETFLLFNVLDNKKKDPILAMIASYDGLESVGVKESKQLLFHLKINNIADLHYLKSYLSTSF
ncbi:hypothetical protein D3C87_645030 [compost metagenome]